MALQTRAVLFDLGDTLLRWTVDAEALRAAAEVRGVRLSPNEAARWWERLHRRPMTAAELDMGSGWTADRYADALRRQYVEADFLAPGMTAWLVERSTDPACYLPFAGAVELLSAVRRLGLRVGAVSDTGFDVRPALDRCRLLEWIEALVLSNEQGACKPAGELFLRACQLLDVSAGDTVMVGDNPIADGGAVAAGLTVLLLPALTPGGSRDFGVVLDLLSGGHQPAE